MNILFINAYFYPEIIAFSHLEQDIMEGLVKAGHRITVVCPVPSRGISDETARKYKTIKNENINGVRIHRYSAPREGRNPAVRAFRYFWCNLRGNMLGKKHRDADVIFAVSTPPTQGLFAGKLAKKLGIPLVYSVQDIFPDSLVTAGMSGKNSLLYKFGRHIENKTYARCKKIIVLSPGAEQNLQKKGAEPSKLVTIGNWIDSDSVRPVSKADNKLFDEFGLDKRKSTVVYAGNLGASQGAEVILQAAKLLEKRGDISFVIFGSGAEYEQTERCITQNNINNISIYPLLPKDRVSEVYSLGDAALITCKKGVGKSGMPSKLWSIMACNTPIAAAFDTDSDLAAVLKDSGAGICVEPENPEALAKAIEACIDRQSELRGGREYVKRHADKQTCVKKYTECIENAALSK